MANINDFKIVNQKSIVLGKSLTFNKPDVDEFTIAQSGFYLLVLECITNEKDEHQMI